MAMADSGIRGCAADPYAQLDALRAAECDPVRFAYLEALLRRAAGQPEAIRQVLMAKINAVANELTKSSRPTASFVSERGEMDTASPLTELLAYIGRHAHEQLETPPPTSGKAALDPKARQKSKKLPVGHRASGPELKSVAYFRDEWSKLSTEQQLTQTLAQAPDNAGPMNSQHLVLCSLERMRNIAPDYLQGFMSYIDTLIWLDHADPTKQKAGRGTGNGSEKKPRKPNTA